MGRGVGGDGVPEHPQQRMGPSGEPWGGEVLSGAVNLLGRLPGGSSWWGAIADRLPGGAGAAGIGWAFASWPAECAWACQLTCYERHVSGGGSATWRTPGTGESELYGGESPVGLWGGEGLGKRGGTVEGRV